MILRGYAGHKIVINCNIINNACDCVTNISCIYTDGRCISSRNEAGVYCRIKFCNLHLRRRSFPAVALIRGTISRCEIDNRQSPVCDAAAAVMNAETAR